MDWKEKLKAIAKDKAFFYVTLDPERALGLEDILPNYTIVCPYRSELIEKLSKRGTRAIALEEFTGALALKKTVIRGTYGLLQLAHDRELIAKGTHVFVLKTSELLEDFCKKQGWNLLAPKAKIAETFENKISQYKLLKDILPYPASFISTVYEIYNKPARLRVFPKNNLRSPLCFVLQFNRGHSGNSTYFIKSKEDLEKLYELFPNRECKVSEYINGKTYTLNCVVLRNGKVITGSLSEQITGLKTATNNPNTTCGNDWSLPRKLHHAQVARIQTIAQKVGNVLHKKGYRGLFGIDVIIEKNTGKVYFIELNTHQPASISFEAKLHRKIGKVPLFAYLILDYARCRTSRIGKPPIFLPFSAKQIIYRNKSSKILKLKDIEKKYSGKGLLARVKYIKPNEEIYRVQL